MGSPLWLPFVVLNILLCRIFFYFCNLFLTDNGGGISLGFRQDCMMTNN